MISTRRRPGPRLVHRLTAMQQAGADLPKLAVMPQLAAPTSSSCWPPPLRWQSRHPETPVITMSMGALGAVSRLCR